MSERRYEIHALIGPCSEAEAEDMLEAVADVVASLGGACRINGWDDGAGAAPVSEGSPGTDEG